MHQVWVHWVEQYRERVIERERMAVAEQHWMAHQESHCWTAWTTYVDHRRRKRDMNGKHKCTTHS